MAALVAPEGATVKPGTYTTPRDTNDRRISTSPRGVAVAHRAVGSAAYGCRATDDGRRTTAPLAFLQRRARGERGERPVVCAARISRPQMVTSRMKSSAVRCRPSPKGEKEEEPATLMVVVDAGRLTGLPRRAPRRRLRRPRWGTAQSVDRPGVRRCSSCGCRTSPGHGPRAGRKGGPRSPMRWRPPGRLRPDLGGAMGPAPRPPRGPPAAGRRPGSASSRLSAAGRPSGSGTRPGQQGRPG